MAENLIIHDGGKQEKYEMLFPQLQALTAEESDLTANLANITAAFKQTFGFFWVGFYIVAGDTLVLAPFQGPLACTRIRFGKGVCGKAWETAQTILVPDVDLFPGHIACSSDSRSEIVVPVSVEGKIVGVLDIDSNRMNDFDETDACWLEKICNEIVAGLFCQKTASVNRKIS